MRFCSLLLVSVLFFGCSDDGTTDLDNPDHVREWANAASALAVFSNAYSSVATVDTGDDFGSGGCPTVEDDGTTVVVTGGCTQSGSNVEWHGSATIVRTANGYEATFDGYGAGPEGEGANELTGTFIVETTADDTHTFVADYKWGGLIEVDVNYTGNVVGGYTGPTLWNGTGAITRSGFTDASGTVTATTVDQLRDNDQCNGESLSGTTTIVHGDRTLLIEYDGATDCDDENSARYSVDGEDRGTIDGITCSASWGRSAPWALLLPLGAATLLALRRRRKG